MENKFYPRVVDFLPNLSLKARVDPKIEYAYGELVASVGKDKIKFDPVNTEFGHAEMDTTDSTRIRYFFGDPDTTVLPEVRLPTKALIEDLYNNVVGGVPELQDCFADAVIVEYHALEPIPKSLIDNEMFGHLDEIRLCQKACGNHNKRYGEFMDMKFIDPYQYARMGLMHHCNTRLNRNLSLRMRSTDVTSSLCGVNGNHILDHKTFDVGGVTTLEKHITQKRWWQDMATFFPFPHYDYIYCLNREKKYMPILPF